MNISKKDLQSVDSPPLSDELLRKMKPVSKSHPERPPRVRGPQKKPTKDRITIRLNREVVAFFKTQGKGWQTNINDALLEHIRRHGAA